MELCLCFPLTPSWCKQGQRNLLTSKSLPVLTYAYRFVIEWLTAKKTWTHLVPCFVVWGGWSETYLEITEMLLSNKTLIVSEYMLFEVKRNSIFLNLSIFMSWTLNCRGEILICKVYQYFKQVIINCLIVHNARTLQEM